MDLKYVQIINFRSIEEVTITFSPRCRILVGINESGKSNILRAMSFLGESVPIPTEDMREPLPNEAPLSSYTVRFVFSLEKETEQLLEAVRPRIYSLIPVDDLHVATAAKSRLSLAEFVKFRSEGTYRIDIDKAKKYSGYWRVDDSKLSIAPGWLKPSTKCPADYKIETTDGQAVLLNSFALLHLQDLADIPSDYVLKATIHDVAALLGGAVMDVVSKNLPNVLFWQYSDANLLPAAISIDAFAANPDICVPLKNMFNLGGIEDIKGAIESVKKKSRNSQTNFYGSIASKATAYFRSVWKEHGDLKFELKPDGDELIPGVVEHNRYDFSKRSDGFKRFVTFLLMVSAVVRSGKLLNTLLLIDEPDLSLHPSGARFLRDELIRISQSNDVVYSTHSMFMIDGDDITRHIIVEKKDEKTKTATATESNIVREEVIYNALGFSIFETLKPKNVLFEGWRDKRLYDVALKRLSSEMAPVKEKLKGVGSCHAAGVKDIRAVTPLLQLAERECIIISDSDVPAKEKQKEYAKIKGYGVWKRYDELCNAPIVTGEDFINASAFVSAANFVRTRRPSLTKLEEAAFLPTKPRLVVVREWLALGGLDKEAQETEINAVKTIVFDHLKASDIEESYYEFLTALSKML